MTDVFISYQRENLDQARVIAEVLAKRGLDVWWDVQLLPGQEFASEINAVISRAKAVVVLWTNKSIHSKWVQAESSLALNRGILIPAQLEKVDLPAPFNTLHTLDLSVWNGSPGDPLLEGLVAGISRLTGKAEAFKKTRTEHEVTEVLKQPAHEVEFWKSVSNKHPQSATEYQLYLEKYGNNGAFTELANLRISKLTVTNDAKKLPNFATVLTLIGVAVTIVVGIVQVIDIVGKGSKVDKTDDRIISSASNTVQVIPPVITGTAVNPSPSSANSTPVARRDNVVTDVFTVVNGSLFGPEFGGADFDPEGDEISVFSVEGSIENVGKSLILPSGATVIVESNGNFSYDPRTGFSFLTNPGSSSADRLTYSIIDKRGAKSLEILSMFMVTYPNVYSRKPTTERKEDISRNIDNRATESAKMRLNDNGLRLQNEVIMGQVSQELINCSLNISETIDLSLTPQLQAVYCKKLIQEIELASGCGVDMVVTEVRGINASVKQYDLHEPYFDLIVTIRTKFKVGCRPIIDETIIAQGRVFPELQQLDTEEHDALKKKIINLLYRG